MCDTVCYVCDDVWNWVSEVKKGIVMYVIDINWCNVAYCHLLWDHEMITYPIPSCCRWLNFANNIFHKIINLISFFWPHISFLIGYITLTWCSCYLVSIIFPGYSISSYLEKGKSELNLHHPCNFEYNTKWSLLYTWRTLNLKCSSQIKNILKIY